MYGYISFKFIQYPVKALLKSYRFWWFSQVGGVDLPRAYQSLFQAIPCGTCCDYLRNHWKSCASFRPVETGWLAV